MMSINNDLESLQHMVGGYIEMLTLCSDLVVICNEDGRLMGLPHCCTIAGVDFVGPVIVAGKKGDDLCSVTTSMDLFRRVWWDDEIHS